MVNFPSEEEFIEMIEKSKQKSLAKDPIVYIKPPVILLGDIHGDVESLVKGIKLAEDENIEQIILLGDVIDRGEYQIEVFLEVLKKRENLQIIHIRGNHEDLSISNRFGFIEVIRKHFSEKVVDKIGEYFSSLSVACIIEGIAFCAHGGFPLGIKDLKQIRKDGPVVENQITREILWNDPVEGWKNYIEFENIDDFGDLRIDNPRGIGYLFTKSQAKKFLEEHQLKYLIRAHIALRSGYIWYNDYTLSVFSSASGPYKGFERAQLIINEEGELRLKKF